MSREFIILKQFHQSGIQKGLWVLTAYRKVFCTRCCSRIFGFRRGQAHKRVHLFDEFFVQLWRSPRPSCKSDSGTLGAGLKAVCKRFFISRSAPGAGPCILMRLLRASTCFVPHFSNWLWTRPLFSGSNSSTASRMRAGAKLLVVFFGFQQQPAATRSSGI